MNKGIMVVKVGTATLSKASGSLDESYIKSLVSQISMLIEAGYKVILVTSGAIGAGMDALGLSKRPVEISKLQACAAIGQSRLMRIYEECFRKHGTHAAQVLVTTDDLGTGKKCINVHHTIMSIINDYKAVPVINENDTVATDEIKYTDNDELAHLVASLISAHTFVILTDVDGVYYPDSKKVIPIFTHIKEDDIKKIAGYSKSKLGTGGMMSKILACNIGKQRGITCIIANGRRKNILLDIEKRDYVGTTFLPFDMERVQTKKSWLAFVPRSRGTVIVDEGAKTALVKGNKSLLAAGVKSIMGKFISGDVVSISEAASGEFAKGMVNFSSTELNMIKGLKTNEIEKKLEHKIKMDEVIHKDNLVILKA